MELALGLLAVTATIAVKGLIGGVVERSLAGIDFRLAVGLYHRAIFRAALSPETGEPHADSSDARAERTAGRATDTVLLSKRIVIVVA